MVFVYGDLICQFGNRLLIASEILPTTPTTPWVRGGLGEVRRQGFGLLVWTLAEAGVQTSNPKPCAHSSDFEGQGDLHKDFKAKV